MKVENMLKLKEEFDYKSLARRLDVQLEKLTVEYEREQKALENEIYHITAEAEKRISEAERNYVDALEVDCYIIQQGRRMLLLFIYIFPVCGR